jgi:hypothetical protein
LKVSDLEPIKDEGIIIAGRLVVYRGEEEQYTTFITRETCDSYQEYLNFRKNHSEEITKESPLFRDKFDPIEGIHHEHIHNSYVEKPIPMTAPAIRKYYNYLFHRLGFRQGPKRRHEFQFMALENFLKPNQSLQA